MIVLAIPVALVALSVAAQGTWWRRRARIVSGALLLFGSLLGAMSVGLPYLPAAVALLVRGATDAAAFARVSCPCRPVAQALCSVPAHREGA